MTLEHILHRVAHWLPAQGPIKDFVHHNTLHGFQHLKFQDAVRAAARLYGARQSMSGEFYFEAFRRGQVTASALDRALERAFAENEERRHAKAQMLSGPLEAPKFMGLARAGLRAQWTSKLSGVSLDRFSHPLLFKLIGGYLDQGLSSWRMPGADQLDFFSAVVSMIQKSWLPLRPLNSKLGKTLLSLDAHEATLEALKLIVGREELYERYILEMLLAQPGWAGLVNQCEHQAASLLSSRRVTLADYVAMALVIEATCLDKQLGGGFKPLGEFVSTGSEGWPPDGIPVPTFEEKLLGVWQEAFEWSYYEQLLGGVYAATSEETAVNSSSAWAFFCIDDRECSLRRHVEEVDPLIETFATAGFFGLDFMYQGAGDTVAGKHCPVPVTPKHIVIEEVEEKPVEETIDHFTWWRRTLTLEPQSNTFFRGWVLSHALGFGSALRLAASVFRPSLAPVSVDPLSTVNQKARLRLSRKDDNQTKEGLWIGYSISELAERVQRLFNSVGVQEPWPRLVVFFGHGSSSVNNPYFAAYNCGACSGRPGAPNARAFAEAANMPEVRQILRANGLEIPDSTWFVGALHDTSKDEVTYYDIERVPKSLERELETFQKSVEVALKRNAAERCRRFDAVPETISPEGALAEVKTRAVSLFEPRPEYNHATNASCVIGRRRLTEGLFLDRRAFLNSYDPTRDPHGEILANVLGAAVPVCGGINLEYYFSRIDAWVYGAGTKLSQNVTGLVGLINGIEGDLLTGLPTQMTEIHDPVRLLMLVEQTPEIALVAARKSPAVFEFIENEWVRYGCVHPMTHEIWLFTEGTMQKVDGLRAPTNRWRDSLEAAHAGRENLPMGFIGKTGGFS